MANGILNTSLCYLQTKISTPPTLSITIYHSCGEQEHFVTHKAKTHPLYDFVTFSLQEVTPRRKEGKTNKVKTTMKTIFPSLEFIRII